MNKLQVEDLETRQLLTSAALHAAPLLSPLFVDAPDGDRLIELPLRVDHNGLVGSADLGWQGGYEVDLDQPGSLTFLGFGARGAEEFYLRLPFAPLPGALGPQWEAGDFLRAGPDHPGAGPGLFRDLEMARGNGGGGLAPPLGPTNSSGGPSLTSPADDRFLRTDRTNAVSAAAFPNAVAPVGGRVEPPGFPAPGSPAWEIRSRDVLFALVAIPGDRSSERRNEAPGIWPASPAELSFAQLSARLLDQAAVVQPFDLSGMELGMNQFLERLQGLGLPYGQVSGVLTMLPPLDVAALELGMREFLDELEGLGQCLTEIGGSTGAYAWVVAVAAAATACEIARRQLRPAGGGIGGINSLTGFQPDRFFLR